MTPDSGSGAAPPQPLSPTDYHVLLVLADRDLYGYAIMRAVEDESGGAVSPEIGSLYRVLARLLGEGLIREADAPEGDDGEHRGRPRRYYRITGEGQRVLRAENLRLKRALALAEERDLMPDSGSGAT